MHDTNAGFVCAGMEVRMAKRTSVLEASEKFYNFGEMLGYYRPHELAIAVFGAMSGGFYSHDAVKASRSVG